MNYIWFFRKLNKKNSILKRDFVCDQPCKYVQGNVNFKSLQKLFANLLKLKFTLKTCKIINKISIKS